MSEPRDTIRGVLCPNNPSRKTHGLDLLVILSPSDPLTRGNTTIQSILSPHIGSLSNTYSQKRVLFITILANPLCVGPDSIYDVCLAHVVEGHMGIERRVTHSLRLAIAISRSAHSHVESVQDLLQLKPLPTVQFLFLGIFSGSNLRWCFQRLIVSTCPFLPAINAH